MRRGEPVSPSNLVAGEWTPATSKAYVGVADQATEAVLARVPMSTGDDVDAVVVAASHAAQAWRVPPVTERIPPLFRLQALLDEHLETVSTTITPFNFPAMILLGVMAYAVATGNAVILKPSEKVPLASRSLSDLADRAGFPKGVVSLLHGGKDAVDALLDHPDVRSVSLVGSTLVARYVHARDREREA